MRIRSAPSRFVASWYPEHPPARHAGRDPL